MLAQAYPRTTTSSFFRILRTLSTRFYRRSQNGHLLPPSERQRRCDRVKHTMTQMLAMVINERQDYYDTQLPQVEFASNSWISATTGSSPNEVHMSRFPRLPLTIFKQNGATSEFAPRSARLLRSGDRPPAALVRHRSRAPRPGNFPRGSPKSRPCRRPAPGPQIHRW